jgi:hypothetical protein
VSLRFFPYFFFSNRPPGLQLRVPVRFPAPTRNSQASAPVRRRDGTAPLREQGTFSPPPPRFPPFFSTLFFFFFFFQYNRMSLVFSGGRRLLFCLSFIFFAAWRFFRRRSPSVPPSVTGRRPFSSPRPATPGVKRRKPLSPSTSSSRALGTDTSVFLPRLAPCRGYTASTTPFAPKGRGPGPPPRAAEAPRPRKSSNGCPIVCVGGGRAGVRSSRGGIVPAIRVGDTVGRRRGDSPRESQPPPPPSPPRPSRPPPPPPPFTGFMGGKQMTPPTLQAMQRHGYVLRGIGVRPQHEASASAVSTLFGEVFALGSEIRMR